jgi:predicted DNA-binding transcriptional regulator YafY
MSLLEIPGKQENYPYINEINSIKEKLTSSLLEEKKEYLENMINKVEMEIDNYYPLEQDIFDTLEKAMDIKKVIEMEYYSVDRDEVNMRRFSPFAVYFKKHGWYTAGYCHLREGIRQFRLDRIKNIKLTDDTYEIPEDFSVEQFLGSSWELFQGGNKTVDIKVKFTGRSARIVKSGQRHPTQKIEEFNDGSIIFSVTLGDWKEFSFWVAGYGAEAEALEPEEMRKFMIEEARKVLEVYGENF